MKDDRYDSNELPADGDLEGLPLEIEPPEALESRVVRALVARDLVRAGGKTPRAGRLGWVAVAAALAVSLTAAFLLGRATAARSAAPVPAEGAAAQFALLLYETDTYDPAKGAEARARYDEYSRWVAEARRRRQFVTGEDLAVDDGFTLAPTHHEPAAAREVSAAPGAVLSGIFFITASDYDDALSLAESLPHLRHGGHVVVQRVIPTDVPPPAEPGGRGPRVPRG
jgi:hypothetical protein